MDDDERNARARHYYQQNVHKNSFKNGQRYSSANSDPVGRTLSQKTKKVY